MMQERAYVEEATTIEMEVEYDEPERKILENNE